MTVQDSDKTRPGPVAQPDGDSGDSDPWQWRHLHWCSDCNDFWEHNEEECCPDKNEFAAWTSFGIPIGEKQPCPRHEERSDR